MTGITAMVVDDDIDTADVLSEFLELKGITVVGKEHSGLEAVRSYERLMPDVIFLDVMMRKDDGFYVLEKIKKIHPDAVIILITSDQTESTRRRLFALNASAIIYKPYEIRQVMETTNRLVSKLRSDLLDDIAHKREQIRKINEILARRLTGDC